MITCCICKKKTITRKLACSECYGIKEEAGFYVETFETLDESNITAKRPLCAKCFKKIKNYLNKLF